MKQVITIVLMCVGHIVFSQQKADDLIGTYMTDKSEGMVEITKKDAKYYGKLIWTKTAGKLDVNNPNEKQKNWLEKKS